jgi:hypothetical protein
MTTGTSIGSMGAVTADADRRRRRGGPLLDATFQMWPSGSATWPL